MTKLTPKKKQNKQIQQTITKCYNTKNTKKDDKMT